MAAQTNFIDIATIWLHAGKGGDGAVSFANSRDVFLRNSTLAARTAATAAAAAISSLWWTIT